MADPKDTEVQSPTDEKAPKTKLCGHVDRHSFGVDKKHDNPKCDLPEGHSGDHHGWHMMRVEIDREYDLDGRLLKILYEDQKAESYWGDMAGTPTKDIPVGKTNSRNKRSEIMQAVQDLMA